VLTEFVWRIGPRWLAVVVAAAIGAAVGFAAGLVATGSPLDSARFFAGVTAFGLAFQAHRSRGEWPGGNRLTRSDRCEVLDAVRDGTDIADATLASETVAWANLRRFDVERDERQRRGVAVALAVLLFWIGGNAIEGRNWLALASAVLLGVVDVWWFARALPPRLVRAGDRAWAAERFARRIVAREQFL